MKLTDADLKVGDEVYICDYRHNNINEKPIRNIRPMKVLVESSSNVKKIIYYTSICFLPYNKNGIVSKNKVIAYYNNTGYRGRTGIPLNVYDNYDDCLCKYVEQVKDAQNLLRKEIKNIEIKINQLNIDMGECINYRE